MTLPCQHGGTTWPDSVAPPQRVHATDKEQTAASLFARKKILHLKERSREFIAAEMWFSFWITARFFLCSECSLSVLISHPWDMLLLLRFFRLTCFWKASDVRTFLLLFELLPRQNRGVYHDFHPSVALDQLRWQQSGLFLQVLTQTGHQSRCGWMVVLPTVDIRTVMRDLSACKAPGSALCSLDYKQRSRGTKIIHSETHIAKLKRDFPHFSVFSQKKKKKKDFLKLVSQHAGWCGSTIKWWSVK